MRGLPILMFLCLGLGSGPAAGGGRADAIPELRARRWFNNPVYRLHDDRQVIIFFFSAKRDGRSNETVRAVRALNRVALNPNVVIIGLTPDPARDAERFIRRHRVRFTVGAGSPSNREFGVKRLPALMRIGVKRDARPQPIDLDSLASLVPSFEEYTVADLGELPQPWQLQALIESRADDHVRRPAIKKLYGMLEPDAFVAFAEDRLANENNPWVRGTLEFYRDLALGIQRNDDGPTALGIAVRAYKSDPGAAEWAPVRQFEQLLRRGMTPEELIEAFQEHASQEPVDLIIRQQAAIELGYPDDQSKPLVRKALLKMLKTEQDPSIRMYLTISLSEVCETGDTEAAEVIEQLAQVESNILLVRPIMEYLAYYIRTGDEDADNMPPP